MAVRRPESCARTQPRVKAQASDVARPRGGDPQPTAPRRPHGKRLPDPPLAVDSSFSGQTPVSASELDAILRLLGNDLDLILGGNKAS